MFKVNLNCNKFSGNEEKFNTEVVSQEVSLIAGNTLEELQKKVAEAISKHDIKSTDFTFTKVYENDEYIGTISYNNNFWNKEHEYGLSW